MILLYRQNENRDFKSAGAHDLKRAEGRIRSKGRGQEVGSREKSGRELLEEYGVRGGKEVESSISEQAGMAWESTESESTLRPYLHPPLGPPVENICRKPPVNTHLLSQELV